LFIVELPLSAYAGKMPKIIQIFKNKCEIFICRAFLLLKPEKQKKSVNFERRNYV